jgi:hypothetical protein
MRRNPRPGSPSPTSSPRHQKRRCPKDGESGGETPRGSLSAVTRATPGYSESGGPLTSLFFHQGHSQPLPARGLPGHQRQDRAPARCPPGRVPIGVPQDSESPGRGPPVRTPTARVHTHPAVQLQSIAGWRPMQQVPRVHGQTGRPFLHPARYWRPVPGRSAEAGPVGDGVIRSHPAPPSAPSKNTRSVSQREYPTRAAARSVSGLCAVI